MSNNKIRTTIMLSKEVKEKAEKYGKEHNKSLSELIEEALKNYIQGKVLILDNLPRPKIINPNFESTCILCGKKVTPTNEFGFPRRVLWIKGLGIICDRCLIEKVISKISDKDYAKTIFKLETEIIRYRALRNDLRKAIIELCRKYYLLDYTVSLSDKIELIQSTIYNYMSTVIIKDEEQRKMLKKIQADLEVIKEYVKKVEIPESWVEKTLKELGLSKEEIHALKHQREVKEILKP